MARPRSSPAFPLPRTSLIGRDPEVALARRILQAGAPLLTLTGPGGVGKTRLALAIAQDLEPSFASGVEFVDLATVRDPGLVPRAIAQALAVHDDAVRDVSDVLATALRARQVLLVLDNCEQVVEAAPALAQLLARCPALQLLATSRVPLRLRGEHVLSISPLSLPPEAAALPEDVVGSDAVTLFVTRAQAADPGFALTSATVADVTAVCGRLDGLPLALELAASRLSALSLSSVLALLPGRLDILPGGPRDLPDRQRTLRDTIAWSYDLLPEHDQAALRALAVCAGGFSLEAAEAILQADPIAILERVTALVESSLLAHERDPDGEDRYRLLETIREFARRQLDESDETRPARESHARFFLDFAERMEQMIHGSSMPRGLDRLQVEYANCRAALDYFIEIEDIDRELRLAAMLSEFWYFRGQMSEGVLVLSEALDRAETAHPGPRSKAMAELGFLHLATGSREDANRLSAQSVQLARETGDDYRLAQALYMRAMVLADDDRQGAVRIALLEEAADLVRHSPPGMDLFPSVLSDLGAEWVRAGDRDRGQALIERALGLFRRGNHSLLVGAALLRLGRLDQEDGKTYRAAARFGESLRAYQQAGMVTQSGFVLVALAGLASARGFHASAARLLGMIAAITDRTGATFDRDATGEMARIERRARSVLSVDFPTNVQEGRLLPSPSAFSAACEIADGLTNDITMPDRNTVAPTLAVPALSKREREVLALLAQRYTDPEIAEHLFISVRTVERHAANVYNKLGVNTRRNAVAAAARLGLI